jgi:hypothetical protein
MAIVSNPLIGRTKQSAGNMTFTKWKDKNVLKNKATEVNNPRSPKQQAQRNAFAFLVTVFPLVALAINIGFKRISTSMTVFNTFIKENFASGGVQANLTPPYDPISTAADLKISKGTLLNTELSTASADASASEVVVTWPTAVSYNQSASDTIFVLVHNADSNEWKSFDTGIARSVGTATLNSAGLALTAGDELNVYTFFYSASGEASDNTYNQVTVVA